MAELLIIADDLTGAIETGVQLSKQGINSRVVLDSDVEWGLILIDKNTTVLVINIESRHLLPAEAADKVSQVFNKIKGSGIKWFYKKTDSTLRGNIGAELETFMKSANQQTLPFVTAHPKLLRFTRKGFQYIGETLLHQTDFANDPLEPIKSSFVPDILKKQTAVRVCVSGTEGISDSSSLHTHPKKIIVFDCESEEDLKIIGKYVLQNNWQKAMAGTAAMVEILPQILQLKSSKVNYENPNSPMLLINGSLNNSSLQQVLYANKKGMVTLSFKQNLLKVSNIKSNSDYKQIIKTIKEKFGAGQDVIINTIDLDIPDQKYNFSLDNSGKGHFKSVSKQIGLIVSNILEEIPFSTLGVFGGDTLNGIMNLLGCDSIEPESEIYTGVALSSVYTKFGKMHLITKPGGYGKKDVILKILSHIKKQSK
ncbi:MAG: hypothetical protein HN778_11595 [Prolixibacteraceae bacterium]|nr:hypothetical protein [Prolixibacteraceae bacterium]MBT6006399.1 hypothetical protein [Prolixibacteraceae bacterium]MBT6764416.1 hypothetical protein [Prolixibacteraceae bacterium]MBT6999847.1 hypothetical protein [Prolixibacteraceae bacterium]MBT7395468.1 hypothetical protein [Prolixibacteraceae bacterium]